jgi:hypothetical protein
VTQVALLDGVEAERCAGLGITEGITCCLRDSSAVDGRTVEDRKAVEADVGKTAEEATGRIGGDNELAGIGDRCASG